MFAINEFGSFSMADSIIAIASSWAPFWLWKSAKEDKTLTLSGFLLKISFRTSSISLNRFNANKASLIFGNTNHDWSEFFSVNLVHIGIACANCFFALSTKSE